MGSVTFPKNGRLDELKGKISRIGLRLLQLSPSLLEQIINSDRSLRPSLCASSLLAQSCQVLQCHSSILHVHGAILSFLWVLQNADNSLADGRQGCGAEKAIAAVEEVDALSFQVDDEALRDAPVQKRARGDEGVGQAAGVCFFLKRVLDQDLILEDRESPGFLRLGVRTELGRNEKLDMGFGRGFH